MKPYIPMLKENNVRKGFFERQQFESVRKYLPNDVQDLITFAYVTGWRINSEVLLLKWPQVDLDVRLVRIEPGMAKNDAAAFFPSQRNLKKS